MPFNLMVTIELLSLIEDLVTTLSILNVGFESVLTTGQPVLRLSII